MSTVRPHTIQRRHTPFQSSARRTPVPHSRQLRTDAVHVARRGVCSDLLTLTVDLGSAVKPQRAMQIGMCPRELPAHKAAAYPQRVVEQSEVGIGAVAEPALLRETEQLRRV